MNLQFVADAAFEKLMHGHGTDTNPKTAGLNKLAAHAPLRALASEDAARALRFEDDHADSEWFRLLTPRDTR